MSAPSCFGMPNQFRLNSLKCAACQAIHLCKDRVSANIVLGDLIAPSMKAPETSPPPQDMDAPPSKYHRLLKRKLKDGTVVRIWVDVYDILDLFQVTNPADQHALKKMLVPGKRGHKDEKTDRDEAAWSLRRAAELEEHRGL